MSKERLKTNFIYPFGPKLSGCNEFSPDMDVTDQRSPVMTMEDAMQMLQIDDELADELDSETMSDFDDDIYDYDDRGELGEDILLSQQPEMIKHAPAVKKRANRRQ